MEEENRGDGRADAMPVGSGGSEAEVEEGDESCQDRASDLEESEDSSGSEDGSESSRSDSESDNQSSSSRSSQESVRPIPAPRRSSRSRKPVVKMNLAQQTEVSEPDFKYDRLDENLVDVVLNRLNILGDQPLSVERVRKIEKMLHCFLVM
jgi:hypothetical protein